MLIYNLMLFFFVSLFFLLVPGRPPSRHSRDRARRQVRVSAEAILLPAARRGLFGEQGVELQRVRVQVSEPVSEALHAGWEHVRLRLPEPGPHVQEHLPREAEPETVTRGMRVSIIIRGAYGYAVPEEVANGAAKRRAQWMNSKIKWSTVVYFLKIYIKTLCKIFKWEIQSLYNYNNCD